MSLHFSEAVNKSDFYFVWRERDIGTIYNSVFSPYEGESFTFNELQDIVKFMLDRL